MDPDLQFVDPVLDSLRCAACKKVVLNPWQIPCGHLMCHNCLIRNESETLYRMENCPTCQQQICDPTAADYLPFKDNNAANKINRLLVYCKNLRHGCQWSGQLIELQGHMRSCEFRLVECPWQCPASIKFGDIRDHLSMCPNQRIECPHCNAMITAATEQAHYEDCPKYPVNCRHCNTNQIPRDHNLRHILEECNVRRGVCPYNMLQCPFEGEPQQVEQHLQEWEMKHVRLVQNKFLQMGDRLQAVEANLARVLQKNESLQATVDSQEKIINQMKGDLELLPVYHERNQKQVKAAQTSMEDRLARLEAAAISGNKNTIKSYEESDDDVTAQNRQVAINEANDKIADLEKQLALLNMQLADSNLKLRILECSTYNGELLWKVDSISRRRQDAISGRTVSLYSPPFYSSRFGYKMCCRLYPNGDGMGKNKFMSLFFVIMKGEYDALLEWPFKQEVSLTLIDSIHKKHKIERFLPAPASSSFLRPVNEMNVATGCPLFVSLDELQANHFITDDSIYIKVSVSTAGLKELP